MWSRGFNGGLFTDVHSHPARRVGRGCRGGPGWEGGVTFEHRQVDLVQERLGKLGLQIERLPGDHLTTHEQPEPWRL